MRERRRWKRYKVAYPIESEKKNIKISPLSLLDVSRDGISFTTKEAPQANDRIGLRIFLKNKMFSLQAIIVYAKLLKKNIYNVGARFQNVPSDFQPLFEKEIEDITEFRRECNLYNQKSLSFKRASAAYLKNTPPSKT